jgi:hypothetical protein
VPADFSWTPTDFDAASNPHTVAVAFTDSHGAASACLLELIVNRPPTAIAVPAITVEAASSAGAVVALDGGGSFDFDDAVLFYHWDVSDLSVMLDDADSAATSGLFPIGVTMATLTVADGRGGVDTFDVVVTVQDTTPPEVMVTTDAGSLWPPNHGMRAVRIVVTATDPGIDPEGIIPLLVTVRSDEPDDAPGGGDGATIGDVDGQGAYSAAADITGLFVFNPLLGEGGAWEATIYLRAERAGSGDGRAYTIDATAFDNQSNFAETSCVVVVPHDKKK